MLGSCTVIKVHGVNPFSKTTNQLSINHINTANMLSLIINLLAFRGPERCQLVLNHGHVTGRQSIASHIASVHDMVACVPLTSVCCHKLPILVFTTTEEGSSSEEEPSPNCSKNNLKSGKVRTSDTLISQCVTWPHEVVYTMAGQPVV